MLAQCLHNANEMPNYVKAQSEILLSTRDQWIAQCTWFQKSSSTSHLPPPPGSWNLRFKVLGEDKYFLSIHSPAVLVMVDTHKYENISVAQVCEEYQRHHQTESHCDSHSQIIRQPEQKSLSFISIVGEQGDGHQQSLGIYCLSHLWSRKREGTYR